MTEGRHDHVTFRKRRRGLPAIGQPSAPLCAHLFSILVRQAIRIGEHADGPIDVQGTEAFREPLERFGFKYDCVDIDGS